MKNYIVSIVGFGALFGIFPLILLYAGIFTNYFAYYEIRGFFNSFFMANLNLIIYAVVGLFSGFCIMANSNFFRFLYLVLIILSILTFIPSVGKNLGEKLFMRENIKVIINGKQEYINIIYRDKHKIYYNTKENKKILEVKNEGK